MLVFQNKIEATVLADMLEHLRSEANVNLTVRSLKFMQLQGFEVEKFLEAHKHVPLKRQVS